MFSHITDSRKKGILQSRYAVVASIVVHVFAFGGGIYASTRPRPKTEDKPVELVKYIELKEPEPVVEEPKEVTPPPPPEEEKPKPVEAPAVLEQPKPIVKGFQTLDAPTEVPQDIPEVDPNAKPVSPEDYSGVGEQGGSAKGVVGGVPKDLTKESEDSNAPMDVRVVDKRPDLVNSREIQRFLERNYPPMMQEAGIEGTVRVRFVIDKEGRVEPESISIIDASHKEFEDATRKAITRLKFKPAQSGGERVRVLIEMPFQWKSDR